MFDSFRRTCNYRSILESSILFFLASGCGVLQHTELIRFDRSGHNLLDRIVSVLLRVL